MYLARSAKVKGLLGIEASRLISVSEMALFAGGCVHAETRGRDVVVEAGRRGTF